MGKEEAARLITHYGPPPPPSSSHELVCVLGKKELGLQGTSAPRFQIQGENVENVEGLLITQQAQS